MSTEQICSTFPEIDKGGKGEMIDRGNDRQTGSETVTFKGKEEKQRM